MEKRERPCLVTGYFVGQILKTLDYPADTPLLEVYAEAYNAVRSSPQVMSGEIQLYGVAEGPFSVPKADEERYAKLIKGPWPLLHIQREAFPLVWVNPPANLIGEYLRFANRHLMPGGVMIAMIKPEYLLISDIEWLTRHYTAWWITDKYLYYGGTCFVAQKSAKPLKPAKEQLKLLQRDLANPNDLEKAIRFQVPAAARPIVPFEGYYINEKEAAELIAGSSLWTQASELFQDLRWANQGKTALGQPPTPLHAGHVALMLAAGHLNGAVGEGETAHLIRGRTTKNTYAIIEEETASSGQSKKIREFYQILIAAVSPNGAYRELGRLAKKGE